MTTTRAAAGPSVALAISLAVVTAAVVRWRAVAVRTERVTVAGDPWDRVKDDYPIFHEPSDVSPPSAAELVDTVLNANPFSPQRRPVGAETADEPSSGGGASASAPVTPKFLYKGHVNLGRRQRAIVTETTAGKTYFLEVGQEVAGFKVLDISQDRVVLSDIKTAEQIVIMLKPEGGQ